MFISGTLIWVGIVQVDKCFLITHRIPHGWYWPILWPLIGQDWSCDLNTGLWLADTGRYSGPHPWAAHNWWLLDLAHWPLHHGKICSSSLHCTILISGIHFSASNISLISSVKDLTCKELSESCREQQIPQNCTCFPTVHCPDLSPLSRPSDRMLDTRPG